MAMLITRSPPQTTDRRRTPPRSGYGGRRHNSRSRSRGRGRYNDYGGRGGYDDRRGGGRYDDRRGGGYGGYGGSSSASTVESGKYKITLEHLPTDMSWTELKELGKQYVGHARDVTFSRTFRNREGIPAGILEFKTREEAETVVSKLDGRKIKGHNDRLTVRHGEIR